MDSSYRKILATPNFLLLWIGQIVSQFGDRLTQMALIGLVHDLFPGSAVGLSVIMALAVIPVFIFSPVAGVYVDRWDKRKTMYISDFIRGVFIFMLPLFYLRSTWFVYLLIFLSFSIGRFFIPAKMAIIPSLVKKEQLFVANSLVSITAMIAAIIGLGLGGVIVEKWGVKTAFLIDATTFLFSALCVILIKQRENLRFNPKDLLEAGKDALLNVRNTMLHELRDGIKYIFSSQETRYAIKIKFILFAAIGSLYSVFIVFIQNTFHSVTLDLGWLAIGIGAGLFIGSLVYGKLGHHLPVKPAIYVSLLLASLHIIGFTSLLNANPNKPAALISCFVLGFLCSPIEIAVNTFIHKKSDDEFLGRIFSSMEVILHVAYIVFMFIAAYLAERMTPFTIIVSVGIILSLFAVYSLVAERKK